MSKLTAIEKKIKRINSRIVDQVKKYGLNKLAVQDYIADLRGLDFVEWKQRKIGIDVNGIPVYTNVPQIKTSNKLGSNAERFISTFEKKKTIAQHIKEIKLEIKNLVPGNEFTYEEVEDILDEYFDALSNATSVINEYYELHGPENTENNEDIAFFRQNTSNLSKLEFLKHYLSLKAENLSMRQEEDSIL